jgi:cytochrome P450
MQTLQQTFKTMYLLLASIPIYYYINTANWKLFNKLFDKLEEISLEFVKAAEEINKNKPSEERIDLIHFMKQEGLNDSQAFKNATSMFIVGSDSTSNSLLWLLHNLGQFPEVQNTLRQEIYSVLGRNSPITSENLRQLKYLRNTIKESLRFTPTLPNLIRFFDKPMVISGYEIPPKIPIALPLLVAFKNPAYFPDPDKFNPERWFKEGHPLQKWINLPFGTGPRMCQGFRISELEMYIAAAKLVQNFEWISEQEVEAKMETFSKPDRPLKIRWKYLN